MRARGFRYCFTPLAGCFSPFPHGTGSLSVTGECLALEGGPPCFPPGFTCPAVLWVRPSRGMGVRVRGSHPLRPAFPCRSAPASLCNRAPGSRPRVRAARNPRWESPWGFPTHRVWASALSLAATRAISVDFSSSGYLDVSVPRVVLACPMHSGMDGGAWPPPGSPIRRPADQRLSAPPRGLSQLAASFFDFLCQGIRRAPMVSWPRIGALKKVSDHGRISVMRHKLMNALIKVFIYHIT